MLSLLALVAVLLTLSIILGILHIKSEPLISDAELSRHPKELRVAVTAFLPVLQNSKDRSDPKLLAAFEEHKESHPLFEDVALGLTYLKFDYKAD